MNVLHYSGFRNKSQVEEFYFPEPFHNPITVSQHLKCPPPPLRAAGLLWRSLTFVTCLLSDRFWQRPPDNAAPSHRRQCHGRLVCICFALEPSWRIQSLVPRPLMPFFRQSVSLLYFQSPQKRPFQQRFLRRRPPSFRVTLIYVAVHTEFLTSVNNQTTLFFLSAVTTAAPPAVDSAVIAGESPVKFPFPDVS